MVVASPKIRSSAVLRLKLIGQMEAWTVNSDNVLPLGRKTRALLAILALSAPRPMVRARLAELLWSRRLEEQARASLRQEIHRLLETLQPVGADVLTITRDHLALKSDLAWIDVEEVLRASVAEPAGLALLDGEVLDEFDGLDPAFDAWLTSERERIRDRARTVAEALLRDRADPETTIPAAQQLLIIDRAHEGAWRALMQAYAVLGERGMAVQAYDRCRAALSDLLDAKPSPETQRLIAEIRAGATPVRPTPGLIPAVSDARPPVRRTSGAKVGVMPLQMSGTGEEAHLSLGLAEEITAALARFRWTFLVSTGSLAQFGSRDETALRQAFGLDFLVDGSLQRSGRRLRVTIRLLDLRAGNRVVWARRFDRQLNDLLSLQDEIAAEVVAQIDPEMLLIEGRRAASQAPVDASAYDLVLRALPLIARLRRDEFKQAGALLSRALDLEPDYAAAHAWRAYWLAFSVGQGWCDDPEAAFVQAGQHADRAITLDPQDARGLTIAGHVRAFLHLKPREALELHGRALSLNPNLAMAWGFAATTYTYLGDVDEATRLFQRYKRLSPVDANAFFFDACMVILEIQKHNYEGAVILGRRSSELNPSFSAALKHYLAALGHAKLPVEAETILQRLLTVEPGFTVQKFMARSPFENASDRDHYALGLRMAGVPEGSRGSHLAGGARVPSLKV